MTLIGYNAEMDFTSSTSYEMHTALEQSIMTRLQLRHAFSIKIC